MQDKRRKKKKKKNSRFLTSIVARMFPEESRASVHRVGVKSRSRERAARLRKSRPIALSHLREAVPSISRLLLLLLLLLFLLLRLLDTLQQTAVLTFIRASGKLLKCCFLHLYERITEYLQVG